MNDSFHLFYCMEISASTVRYFPSGRIFACVVKCFSSICCGAIISFSKQKEAYDEKSLGLLRYSKE